MIGAVARGLARGIGRAATPYLGKGSAARLLSRDYTAIFRRTLGAPRRGYIGAALLAGACIHQFSKERSAAAASEDPRPVFFLTSGSYQGSYYNPIPPHIVQKMVGRSYKEECPVPLTDLAYVRVTHYDMEGRICTGELVVHKKIAPEVVRIFEEIFAARFPIEKMRLIDEYEANDDRSMEDNNSSAFCFRSITNRPGVVSLHGLGLAIDINTRINPYVKGDVVAPPNGRQYVDRSQNVPGMIHPDSAVVRAFKERGFSWGGEWTTLKDYQHFEAPRSTIA